MSKEPEWPGMQGSTQEGPGVLTSSDSIYGNEDPGRSLRHKCHCAAMKGRQREGKGAAKRALVVIKDQSGER
jgi:hypothetical protein